MTAGGGDQVGGLFDGFAFSRRVGALLAVSSRTSTRAVDCSASFAEGNCDTASGPAGGAGYQSDLAVQGLVR
jgi:hypothetical protein